MDAVNILVALDQNYLPQLRVLLTSIRVNDPGEQIRLYLFHSGLPEQELERIRTWCGQHSYGFAPI